jgi:hypothetical protein
MVTGPAVFFVFEGGHEAAETFLKQTGSRHIDRNGVESVFNFHVPAGARYAMSDSIARKAKRRPKRLGLPGASNRTIHEDQ